MVIYSLFPGTDLRACHVSTIWWTRDTSFPFLSSVFHLMEIILVIVIENHISSNFILNYVIRCYDADVDACAVAALCPSLGLSRDACPLPGPRCLILPATCGGGCASGSIFSMVPTAFVRPSRKIIRVFGLRYSGCLIKRNVTFALSPVRRWAWLILIIVAVCLRLLQWTEER